MAPRCLCFLCFKCRCTGSTGNAKNLLCCFSSFLMLYICFHLLFITVNIFCSFLCYYCITGFAPFDGPGCQQPSVEARKLPGKLVSTMLETDTFWNCKPGARPVSTDLPAPAHTSCAYTYMDQAIDDIPGVIWLNSGTDLGCFLMLYSCRII